MASATMERRASEPGRFADGEGRWLDRTITLAGESHSLAQVATWLSEAVRKVRGSWSVETKQTSLLIQPLWESFIAPK